MESSGLDLAEKEEEEKKKNRKKRRNAGFFCVYAWFGGEGFGSQLNAFVSGEQIVIVY